MASSRCRKFPAAAVLPRKMTGGCISAWAEIRTIEKAVIRWPSGKVQTIDKPAANQLHKMKEPA